MTEDSIVSEGLRQQIEVNNRLLDSLDESPDAVLSRLFSLRSAISTASSFVVFHQNHQDTDVGYQRVGFGQCGLVFAKPGRGYVVKVRKWGERGK